jgi:hypothetical protein
MAREEQLQTDETAQLISADKVEGTAVYNRAGEKLGTVKNIMIHKLSGKVAYAVMSFGGFLGMGEKYHALPWGVLTYDTNMGGYVVDIDKARLEGAPVLAADETSRLEDQAYGRQLHDYYGTRPYWGE